jgi:hypothetical protein
LLILKKFKRMMILLISGNKLRQLLSFVIQRDFLISLRGQKRYRLQIIRIALR